MCVSYNYEKRIEMKQDVKTPNFYSVLSKVESEATSILS